MHADDTTTYPPLNALKPVAEQVWIVDGPAIRFGVPLLKMPFPTRMTVVRLGESLFIHSPTPLTSALKSEIDRAGIPRWIVGPNRLHYWWIPEWHAGYPDADVYLAPRIRAQAGARIDFACHTLERDSGYPWDHAIATLSIAGNYMTEMAFFHRSSRTVVLTDFIENFELDKTRSPLMRLLIRIGGVRDPDGSMPRDMRLSYTDKKTLKVAVETMIAWNPERVILAHGRWYTRDGVAELRRAFRWLL